MTIIPPDPRTPCPSNIPEAAGPEPIPGGGSPSSPTAQGPNPGASFATAAAHVHPTGGPAKSDGGDTELKLALVDLAGLAQATTEETIPDETQINPALDKLAALAKAKGSAEKVRDAVVELVTSEHSEDEEQGARLALKALEVLESRALGAMAPEAIKHALRQRLEDKALPNLQARKQLDAGLIELGGEYPGDILMEAINIAAPKFLATLKAIKENDQAQARSSASEVNDALIATVSTRIYTSEDIFCTNLIALLDLFEMTVLTQISKADLVRTNRPSNMTARELEESNILNSKLQTLVIAGEMIAHDCEITKNGSTVIPMGDSGQAIRSTSLERSSLQIVLNNLGLSYADVMTKVLGLGA